MGRRINGIMRPLLPLVLLVYYYCCPAFFFKIFVMDLSYFSTTRFVHKIISILVLLSLIYHYVGILRRNVTLFFVCFLALASCCFQLLSPNDIYTNIAILHSYIRASDALTCTLRTVQFCSQLEYGVMYY